MNEKSMLHKLSIIDTREKTELRLDSFKINGVKGYEVKNSVDKRVAELSLKIVLEGVDGYIESKEKTQIEDSITDLIKIAEEQIKTLGDIQSSSITDEKVLVGASIEIRNWCEFLLKINNPLQTMQGVTN